MLNTRATRAVLRNLDRIPPDGMWESTGDRFSNQPLDAFTSDCKVWLRDRSRLVESTIEGADWAEVYKFFTEGN